ncbi:MAG: 3'-5' exonuclease [Treponema sp.]|jgi:DNA polymerase-3 subunit epsilon|nr:3'-5' exonuclease [Treponema sp.]
MNEFIAIDFETGNNSPASAISIGLVKFRDFEVVDSYYSLIQPPTLYIRGDFTDIHGLTADDVKDADNFGFLWENEIKHFTGGAVLAAHNASFDMNVLYSTLMHYGIQTPSNPYFCTLNLSRRAWPRLGSHALSALGRHFNIVYNAHNALDDAMTCGKLAHLAARKYRTGNDILRLLKAAGLSLKYEY